jgi:hypothetical protein
MKISILVIALISVSLIYILEQNNDYDEVKNNHASIEFDQTTHDFGNIKEAYGSVDHTFEFTNNGTSELIVQDVKTSCGCTTPEWTRELVKPGEKGFITAEYDPNNRSGIFNKSLTIVSNAYSQQMSG